MGRSAVLRKASRASFFLSALPLAAISASAQQIPDVGPAASAVRSLQLDIVVNGRPVNLTIPVTALPSGELVVERGELEDAGVKAPGAAGRTEKIVLGNTGLAHRYDEAQQRLYFDLSDEQRMPKIYDTRGERPSAPDPTSSWGALLNYAMFASSSSSISHWAPKLSGANASLDMRIFSPVGALTQTGIVGDTLNYDLFRVGHSSGLRLDTTYSYVDPENLIAYRAGDLISGGLEWTRPVRLGGVQIQRNFAVRSDLVTAPLPSFSGSAAVPSTVDVFVNGSKTYSQQIDEGPFRITNLPIMTSGGNAEVVIRDASGRETKSEVSLFSGQRLLAEGLFDFTMEAGFSRRFYAVRSNDYDKHPVGAGTFRYGLTNSVTIEGHAEGGAGVMNGGAGAVIGLRQFGTTEVAISGSLGASAAGGQIFASHRYMGPSGINLTLSTQRTFGGFEDLASRTAQFSRQPAYGGGASLVPRFFQGAFSTFGAHPRAVDRVSISAPVYGLGGVASLAFAQVLYDQNAFVTDSWGGFINSRNSRTVSASYSRQLPFDGNLFVTAYANFSGIKDKGVFVGVTFPLYDDVRATLGAQSIPDPLTGKTKIGGNMQLQKPMGGEIGDYGWTLNATQGQNSLRGGNVSYRSSLGTARANVIQQGRFANANVQFDGAIAIAGTSVAAGPTVHDAFAIVDAGAPDVTVLQDSRAVGRTNLFGKFLVPNLRSYERNKIGIDPDTLPPEAVSAETEQIVAPTYRSGVGIDFGVKTNVKSVVLILTDSAGKAIEAGSRGRLEGGGGAFVVGYEGRAYLQDISGGNTVVIDLGDRDCRATFDPGVKGREVRAVCE